MDHANYNREEAGMRYGSPDVLRTKRAGKQMRERMKRAVASLGRAEVEALLAEGDAQARGGAVEVTCEFCKTTELLDGGELRALSAEMFGDDGQ